MYTRRSHFLARHTHDLPTICSVQHGSFTEYYPGKAVECGGGTLKVTPAGEPHWNRFDGVTTFGLRIDVDPGRFNGHGPVRRMLGERIFLTAGVLDALTRDIAAEVRGRDTVAPVAAEGLLLELVARMARVAESREPLAPAWLRRADEIVHDLFRTPLTVASIAAEVGVHGSTLARRYRQEYGCTIARRLRALRIEHAARRLSSSDAAISGIALDAGFYDQSHFTNAFRSHMGITPAEYRRRHRAH
ncbi:MAG TPA: AraC family transcriptional regulator [Longimicrobiales bacterium]|nr:AraC family transcriptional regulator [Longimicrobiales bacterium]